MRYQLLGKFQYVGETITLRQAEDESHWEVEVAGGYLHAQTVRDSDLRLARQLFQDLVAELISRVSFTDVSIYGQQKAPWEHNSQRPQN